MPQGKPMPGEFYRHFKDKNYQIIAVATHSETGEKYVVYQALYGDFRTYIRPYDMFISEVDHVKYPEVKQKYRFAYVGNCMDEMVQAEDGNASEGNPQVMETEKVVEKVAFQTSQVQNVETQTTDARAQKTKFQENSPQPISENLEGVDARLLAFLDAKDFNDKLKIVIDMERDLDDHLINQMAASIDAVVEDGDLDHRISDLETCIRMHARFEVRR